MVDRLSREQIARIVNNDQEAIRVFERLLRQSTQEQPAEIIALREDTEALQQAPDLPYGLEALSWLARLEDRIDSLAYGQVIKTASQVAGAPDTATAITWTNAPVARGISLGTPASRIVFARAGVYKLDLSVQLQSASAAAKNGWVWFAVNGTDVASSALIETEADSSGYATISRAEFFEVSAGDYVEAKFSVSDVNLSLTAVAATAFAPAAPSAVATITQVQP